MKQYIQIHLAPRAALDALGIRLHSGTTGINITSRGNRRMHRSSDHRQQNQDCSKSYQCGKNAHALASTAFYRGKKCSFSLYALYQKWQGDRRLPGTFIDMNATYAQPTTRSPTLTLPSFLLEDET